MRRNVFISVFLRELHLLFRRLADVVVPLIFILLVITLFSLALGAKSDVLQAVGPSLLWVSAILSSLLSLERLFADDYRDGTLEQYCVSGHALEFIVLGKVLAHWLSVICPLLLISPLLAMLLALSFEDFLVTSVTLLLGTPVFSLVGGIGVALTVSLRRGGGLLSLLVLPLYIPMLIFASSAIELASLDLSYKSQLLFMAALNLGSLSLAPFAMASALRMSIT